MALMYDEFGRAGEKTPGRPPGCGRGASSPGAVGTSAHLSPRIETFVCKKLGLRPAPHRNAGDPGATSNAEFMTTLALVGASIERWATEFRHLQRTEVLEAEEFFCPGPKRLEARCPTKRNPITGERLTGLGARFCAAIAVAALENVALWHERDISHSSVRTRDFPPIPAPCLDYMLVTLARLTEGLIIYPENMKRNLGLSLGMWNSPDRPPGADQERPHPGGGL